MISWKSKTVEIAGFAKLHILYMLAIGEHGEVNICFLVSDKMILKYSIYRNILCQNPIIE